MDRTSSVEDIVSTFWNEEASCGSGMNRSASEFAFQEFILKEARPKSRLGINLDPAFTPVTPMFANSDEVAAFGPNLFPVEDDAKSFPGGFAAPDYGVFLSRANGDGLGNTGAGAPLPLVKSDGDTSGKSRPITSGSDVSDDEQDLLNQNLPRSELKRVKRMLSNRESARRSRRRKQAHLNQLEDQVAHLRNENTTLIQRLQEVSHLHKEAAIDNRILKADVEALRAKMKMAEGMMAQQGVTDFNLDSSFSFMTPYMDVEDRAFPHSSMLRQELQQNNVATHPLRVASQKRMRSGGCCHAPAAWSAWEHMDRPAMVQEHGV